jgi:phosphate transport system substrate-binding protein
LFKFVGNIHFSVMKTYALLTTTLLISLCTGFLLLNSCNQPAGSGSGSPGDTLKGKITISGAFALYPLVVRWAEEFQKIYPRVTINVSAGGAGKGMADALSHMVDLGMYSKEVSPEERARGAWLLAVARDAVLPTMNAANPMLGDLKAKGMTRQKFYDIFISHKITTWEQAIENGPKVEIQIFTRSDACGAADMWAKYLFNKKQDDLQGLGVNGDPGVADAVRRNPDGLGYNNLGFVYEYQSRKPYQGLAVIPIDLNENGKIDPDENFYDTMDGVMKAISEGKFPSPPARDLYLVSGGKPDNKLVLAFLRWVLSDGQKFVSEAGYVHIPEATRMSEIQNLR